MDTYIVLAGGYYHLSRNPEIGGAQVDPEDAENRETVDYIIRVNGLPNAFFKPTEIKRRYRYYCNTCERWVHSEEVKNNIGCIVLKEHNVTMQYLDVPEWEQGAVDRYAIERQKWMDPCYRIFLSHSKGKNKWIDIWRYIDRALPITVRRSDKMAVAVGDRRQWTVAPGDIPVIDLPYDPKTDPDPEPRGFDKEWRNIEFKRKLDTAPAAEQEKKTPAEDETIECQACGAQVKGRKGLFAHMLSAHKVKIKDKDGDEKT